jgi:hypothetical protein
MAKELKIPTNCPYCGKLVNYLNHKHHLYMYCTNEKPKTLLDGLEKKEVVKIKYDYNCKHYFGIVSAENEEEAKKILHKDHTGNGDKLCNWSKTTKNDCQINCKLKLKKQ